jgi:hypothetical protein
MVLPLSKRPRTRTKSGLAMLLLLSAPSVPAEAAPQPAAFSAAAPGGPPPAGWVLVPAPKASNATRFDLVADGGATVLRARSEAAAASLVYKLRVEPAEAPRLAWRWKVSRVLDRADLATRDGDDYAARVYVFFDYDLSRLPFTERAKIVLARALYGADLPAASLCYVWDNHYPVGTRAWSAYTDRVRMIVLESGSARAGRWVAETRDLAADFREAFGEAPPAVSGVALAADTDNTGESAMSYFGDLVFQPSETVEGSSGP